ncbi:MAG: CoA-transferase [Dehalococcoidia bacterium]|nr:CoA-transferase [Dehalococcoidia bacterium]
MTTEITFTDLEANICSISRLIEEDKLYFVQMAGPPLFAALLAKRTHAPNVGYLVEEGAITPSPSFPLPRMMLGAGRSHFRSVAWEGMNIVDAHSCLGYADYGILSAVQIDKYGNFNSTILGQDYDKPDRRFGGPGGANEIASTVWRTIIMTKLEKRKFVEKCDFVSSPGYIDGSPGARERAGMPPNTGPYKVVTERAIFGFDEETHVMRLEAVAPWITVDEVLERMEFKPLIAEKLDVLQPPTEEELAIIRAEIDPGGYTLSRGEWITATV